MNAAQLLRDLRNRGASLTFHGDRLRIQPPGALADTGVREAVTTHKRAIIGILTAEASAARPRPRPQPQRVFTVPELVAGLGRNGVTLTSWTDEEGRGWPALVQREGKPIPSALTEAVCGQWRSVLDALEAVEPCPIPDEPRKPPAPMTPGVPWHRQGCGGPPDCEYCQWAEGEGCP